MSSQYGREGGGEAPPAPRARSPPAPAGGGSARYKHHGSFSFTNIRASACCGVRACGAPRALRQTAPHAWREGRGADAGAGAGAWWADAE